jgi:1-deoxypentalenic acid 11beta-hydroxylase
MNNDSVENSPVLGKLLESTEHLDSLKDLNNIFDEHGYLFLRGVLKGIDEIKRDYVRILAEQGAVNSGNADPIWTGLSFDKIDDTDLYQTASCTALFENTHNLRLFEKIFGEPVFVFKSPTVRYALPDDPEHVSPAHQDYYFVRINTSFRTFWIPLMEIDETVGGLAIAPGAHRLGLFDHAEIDNVYSYVFKGRKQKGIPMNMIPHPWLTADYRPGDLLVFHNLMIHWALPNRSDRIRLSIDNRCCPVDAPRTWQSEKSIPEARRFRKIAQQIASEEGIGEDLFEPIMIELMGRGLEPGRSQIKALAAELTSHSSQHS